MTPKRLLQAIALPVFMLFLIQAAFSQERTVRGKVTSSTNSPLQGVTVQVKGSRSGTATNGNGEFSISVPNANSVLVFSSIGFTTQEVTVGSQTEINIQ